jgi:hypothetical protein
MPKSWQFLAVAQKSVENPSPFFWQFWAVGSRRTDLRPHESGARNLAGARVLTSGLLHEQKTKQRDESFCLTKPRLQAWRRANARPTDDQLLLDKDELAKRLRLTRRGVECLVAAKKIPVIRISRQIVRFSWPRVQAALDKLEIQAI